MQVALRPDRTVHALGFGVAPSLHETAPGVLEEGTVETISDETHTAILAAMPDHGGGVTLSEDHQTITPNPEPEASIQMREAAQAAATQRAADIALLAASDDPYHQAIARLMQR